MPINMEDIAVSTQRARIYTTQTPGVTTNTASVTWNDIYNGASRIAYSPYENTYTVTVNDRAGTRYTFPAPHVQWDRLYRVEGFVPQSDFYYTADANTNASPLYTSAEITTKEEKEEAKLEVSPELEEFLDELLGKEAD